MEKTITIAICDDEKAIRDEISECIRDIVSDATIKCYDSAGDIIRYQNVSLLSQSK